MQNIFHLVDAQVYCDSEDRTAKEREALSDDLQVACVVHGKYDMGARDWLVTRQQTEERMVVLIVLRPRPIGAKTSGSSQEGDTEHAVHFFRAGQVRISSRC